jgi:large subunit ribosomal protein L6
MSRIGNRAVRIPGGVSVTRADGAVQVKGPKGSLSQRLPEGIDLQIGDGEVRLARGDDRKPTRARHGLARALLANMVRGVTDGFSKVLEIHGVGYRAEVTGRKLRLSLGFSHFIELDIPEGLTVSVQEGRIRVEGADRHDVGQFASDVRGIRPPEPYKGKGIRYATEHVRRKVGKAGTA